MAFGVANVSSENNTMKSGKLLLTKGTSCRKSWNRLEWKCKKINKVMPIKQVDTWTWSKPLQEFFQRWKTWKLEWWPAVKFRLHAGQIILIFSNSSTDIVNTNIMKHSNMTGSARPIELSPRYMSRVFVEQEENIIKEQIDAGLIGESYSPWTASLVFVKTKDWTISSCVDYRRLNAVIEKNAYPLASPSIRLFG